MSATFQVTDTYFGEDGQFGRGFHENTVGGGRIEVPGDYVPDAEVILDGQEQPVQIIGMASHEDLIAILRDEGSFKTLVAVAIATHQQIGPEL